MRLSPINYNIILARDQFKLKRKTLQLCWLYDFSICNFVCDYWLSYGIFILFLTSFFSSLSLSHCIHVLTSISQLSLTVIANGGLILDEKRQAHFAHVALEMVPNQSNNRIETIVYCSLVLCVVISEGIAVNWGLRSHVQHILFHTHTHIKRQQWVELPLSSSAQHCLQFGCFGFSQRVKHSTLFLSSIKLIL